MGAPRDNSILSRVEQAARWEIDRTDRKNREIATNRANMLWKWPKAEFIKNKTLENLVVCEKWLKKPIVMIKINDIKRIFHVYIFDY